VNEFLLRAPDKWESYKRLIQSVTSRINREYPELPVAESVSLHNLIEPDIPDPLNYVNEMTAHMNQMDFVAISFYPFFKNLSSADEFQEAFDFLHERITRPIAFAETSHIAENLVVPNLGLSIDGSELGQNSYLQTLLQNARDQDYLFVVWWAHRDYDALWETFPEEVKDIGQLWRDSGLLDENGNERPAMATWLDNLSN